MGGPGSGNCWRSKRATCEGALRIDLVYLRKNRMLNPGRGYSLNWSRNGEPSGSIGYDCEDGFLTLRYKQRYYGDGEWQDILQRVPLVRSRVHFGGERRWFLCPHCHRRCRILYLNARFFCRTCQGLGYETQSESGWQRAVTRCQKIRMRLGLDGGMDDPFPEKPKGMHWKTYRRLKSMDDWGQAVWEQALAVFIGKL